MARRPPRVTSTRRQPTTRGGPVVTSRRAQPTTRNPFGPSYISGWQNIRQPGARPGAAGGGTPPAPAAPAAAAPAAYSTANLPPDASYDAVIASLQKQRDEQLAAVTQARTSGLSDYGFTEEPGGHRAFDPNNPFSKAALLKKSYDTNRRSTGQSMAAGGQLYSGAFQNAQDLVNRNQLQSEDQMQKALIGFLARNTQQTREAGTGYETAAGEAYGDRLGRFQTNPLYDPAASGTDPGAAAIAAAQARGAAAPKAPTNRRPRRPRGIGASAISGYYRR